jgi:uncharacterized protein YqjF (DUF2071 family)
MTSNRTVLKETAHRPWPMPDRPWVMRQSWHDLLFAHWPLKPAELRPLVPPTFDLDLFGGDAWLGIVPFHMTNVAPRGMPALPWVSAFPELNVRTYVRVADRPGIYFFSLDAGSALAVRAARAVFNLPYHRASMKVACRDALIEYKSRRTRGAAEFAATYQPTGVPFTATKPSLEYFLTERYCLYHMNRRGLPYRLEIHHPAWMLQLAEGNLARNTMAEANGLRLPNRPPILHFAKRQDAIAWAPTRLRL